MRIITGTAKGTKLFTLEGDATRPTSERAKEAVFSMIQSEIRGSRVLDVFAGSGQMALEALSRGAESAVLIDRSPDAAEIIKKNAAKTRLSDKCRIVCADSLSVLAKTPYGPFGLVFCDPPYALGLVPRVLSLLLTRGLLSEGALIVCETASPDDVLGGDEALAAGFTVKKASKYGIAHITVLEKNAP